MSAISEGGEREFQFLLANLKTAIAEYEKALRKYEKNRYVPTHKTAWLSAYSKLSAAQWELQEFRYVLSLRM